MKREIKFRAWDKVSRKMIVEDGSFNKWVTPYGIITISKTNNFDLSDPQDIYVMQFTGLLDRNKIRIFEGDIVKTATCYCGDSSYNEGIGEVIWDAPEFWITGYKGCEDNGFTNCEVIGNIYENPELLKTKE